MVLHKHVYFANLGLPIMGAKRPRNCLKILMLHFFSTGILLIVRLLLSLGVFSFVFTETITFHMITKLFFWKFDYFGTTEGLWFFYMIKFWLDLHRSSINLMNLYQIHADLGSICSNIA